MTNEYLAIVSSSESFFLHRYRVLDRIKLVVCAYIFLNLSHICPLYIRTAIKLAQYWEKHVVRVIVASRDMTSFFRFN